MSLLPRAIAMQGIGFAPIAVLTQGFAPNLGGSDRPKKMIAYPGVMMNR
jgi:hypothetical protein